MEKHIKVLLLEDTPLDAELIERQLVKGGLDFELLVVNSKSKFERALNDFAADIILSDHSLPNFDSHDALEMIRNSGVIVPFILITSTMTDEFAVKVMQDGAHDYIIKDRLLRLPSAVKNLIEKFHLAKEQREERYRSSENMKYLNHRLLLATKSADIGIWDWNLVTGQLEWDESMYRMYHIRPDEFGSVYDSWLARLHPDDSDVINMRIQMALAGTEKYDTEFRIIGNGGQIHYLRAAGIVEHDSTGVAVRMIGINWDITKSKQANREREHIIEDMVQRNTALEQFAYIISHNLRAPIANIIGATDSLTEPDIEPADRDMLTRGINESVKKLDTIVKDLNYILEVKGEKYGHKEVIQFADLVEDIKDSITDVISNNNVMISYDFSAVSGLSILKPYAYSIFYNLITNSIKYRQQGKQCITTIRSELIDNKIVLYFTDNGTGINISKHGENIFGLYKRFHTNVAGKGMGLFMVKTQVEKLGGKISVKSIENEETEFKIVFEQ